MRANQKRTIEKPFSVRSDGAEKRIEGYFAVFDDVYQMWDGYTESIDKHAFDGQLESDVRCLIDHDTRLVLGRTTAGTLELKVDERGLWGSVLINQDDTEAMNLYARVQRGDVSQCSFGFDITDEEAEHHKDGSTHYTIKAVKLYEVSCCTFPAYQGTEIEARKAELLADRRGEVERWKKNVERKMKKC